MYRPPDACDFFDHIGPTLEKAWLKSSNIILLGDFNCDLLNRGNPEIPVHTNAEKLCSVFDLFGMQNVVQEATRTTITSRTLIDLIVTTRKDLISISGAFPLGISDHDLIYATIRLKNKRPPPKYIRTRDYRKLDPEKFRGDIESAPFHVASVFDDADDILWAWQKLFTNICDDHAPWKEVKIRSSSAPWITSDIRFKMNRRYKLFKKATTTKCPLLWQEYKKVRNEVTSDLRKAKASHFSKMFKEVKKTSAYWNLISKATNSRVHMKNIGPLKRSDASLVVADAEKARLMNSHFALVGEKLANALPLPRKRECQNATDIFDEPSPLMEITISSQSVGEKVNSLNTNKSPGPDSISPKLIKLAGNAIVPSLVSLYHVSIKCRAVYSDWKIARLTPIYKKDDETDCGNYRPVSLLSVPSKIMESEVNDTIVRHVFKDNNLVSNKQWAYRTGYSTELLLTHLTETWRTAIDSGKVVAVAFIDFKKAFDSVSHDILEMKLNRDFGITGTFLDWLKSYLHGRQQFTVLNGVKSERSWVSFGIPQGSVLGPTLFTLFTNDLPASVSSGSLYMYADDTTAYCIGETMDIAIAQ